MYTGVGQLTFDTGPISKAIVDQVVAQVKPRIPELVDTAMNAAVPKALDALKKNAPKIISSVTPPLEDYVKNRFYPNVVKPIVEKEVGKIQSTGKETVRVASLAAGGTTLLAVIGYLIYRSRK